MKSGRQDMIISIISENDVETQEELARLLNESGYKVTQATVSRDIRGLKLTKTPGDSGRQRYIAPERNDSSVDRKYIHVLKDAILSIDKAENILVIKTVSGMAMAVAAAVDALNIPEIAGSIAGDDTIMCAVRTTEQVGSVIKDLSEHMGDWSCLQ